MSIISKKFSNVKYGDEFPDIDAVIIYESGGDFETYSKLIGYDNFDEFLKDADEFWNLHCSESSPFAKIIIERETLKVFTSLMRYGYNEAIEEIINFVSDNCELIPYEEFAGKLQNKLSQMKREKKNINFEKLQKEVENV